MKNELKIGVLLSYIQCGLSALIGLVFIPILISFLSTSEYGIYQLMGSFLSTMLVLDLGMTGTITRYYSKYTALRDNYNKENVLAIASIIYIFISILVVLLGIIILSKFDLLFGNSLTGYELKQCRNIFIIIIINSFIVISTNIYPSVIQAEEKFIFSKVMLILRTIFLPIVTIMFLLFKSTAVNVFLVQLMFSVVTALFNIWYCKNKIKIKIKLHKFDTFLIFELLHYAFYLFLNTVVDELYWRSDAVILGSVSGTSIVAVYGTASTVVTQFRNFASVVHGIMLPKLTKISVANHNMKHINTLFIQVSRIQYYIVMLIFLGFLIFGKEFIAIWAGKGYEDAYLLALIPMVGLIVPLTQSLGISILRAKNLQKFRAILYIIIAILNVMLSIPAAILFGGFGCTIITTIFLIIGNTIIMDIYYYKYVKLNIKRYWIDFILFLKPTCICLCSGLLLNNVSQSPTFLILSMKIIIFIIVYIFIFYYFGFNKYEKNTCKKFLEILKGHRVC